MDNNILYSQNCSLSKIEWEIIKDIRFVLSNDYGCVTVKIDSGKISDVHPTLYRSKSKIRELQK